MVNVIHGINLYPRIAQLASLIFIHWIVIYPVDSAIQLLSNWGQYLLNLSLVVSVIFFLGICTSYFLSLPSYHVPDCSEWSLTPLMASYTSVDAGI